MDYENLPFQYQANLSKEITQKMYFQGKPFEELIFVLSDKREAFGNNLWKVNKVNVCD